jgi:TonB family protein
MRKIFILFLLLGYTGVYAQNSSPKFPYNLSDWLSEQVNYPKEAADKKIQGNVFVRFNVERNGSVSHIKIVKGVKNGELLDKEAERIVSIMPKWTPGYQDGSPFRTELTIKIRFALQNDSITKASLYKTDSSLQQIPLFQGDLNRWIKGNIKYPDDASRNNKEGIVLVSFIVEKDGSVDSVKVLGGAEYSLNQEAIRVVSNMPKWSPGIKNDKPVSVHLMLPIHFVLSNPRGW